MNLSNLKRSIFALLAVFSIAGLSNPASAGGVYFGINLELIGGPLDLRLDKNCASHHYRFRACRLATISKMARTATALD